MHTLRFAPLVVLAIAALTACSSPAPVSTNPDGSGVPAPGSSAPVAPAASGPDACELVSESLITTVLGTDPGAATSSAGFGGDGSSTCKYANADLVTQVSLQADLYYPASIYDKSQVQDAVDPTSGDRGYIATGSVLVVKGQVGVFVTGSAITSVDQGQELAAAIVAAQ